jgi:hypothetical protein
LSSLSNADIEAAVKLIVKDSAVQKTPHNFKIDKDNSESFSSQIITRSIIEPVTEGSVFSMVAVK